jgi:hypothetical protein
LVLVFCDSAVLALGVIESLLIEPLLREIFCLLKRDGITGDTYGSTHTASCALKLHTSIAASTPTATCPAIQTHPHNKQTPRICMEHITPPEAEAESGERRGHGAQPTLLAVCARLAGAETISRCVEQTAEAASVHHAALQARLHPIAGVRR